MSADNYLYVRRADDMWTVTMEFASDEEPRPVRREDPLFETSAEAHAYAEGWMRGEDYPIEYGIRVQRTPEDGSP